MTGGRFIQKLVLAGVCAALLPSGVNAQIYTYRDEKGQLVLANKPEAGKPQASKPESAKPEPASQSAPSARPARPDSPEVRDRKIMYEGLINEHARMNDVRPELIKAVVQVESAYNPYAVSPKGAQGLMQLMPSTAHKLGVKNAFSPEENVRAGVAYLRELLDKYDNDEQLALAAYNAGPNAVDKYGQTVPPYSETKNYVTQIGQMTTPAPSEPRVNVVIYKVTEIVNGQPRIRFTDKRPTSGAYEIVGRR